MTVDNEEVFAICTPRFLTPELLEEAERIAAGTNTANGGDAAAGSGKRLVVSKRVYWGTQGVRLTVGFLEETSAELRRRILSHMNAWSETANVQFVESNTDPQVRISREGEGYWSYLGKDILLIDKNKPTMNLEGFTMETRDTEFFRVVRHETGHTLGFPHEHMRKALIERLDRQKVIEEFMRTQGWSEEEVIAQVLTPLEDASIFGSSEADANSIMCYQIPGRLTLDGKPIVGGTDIDKIDYKIAGLLYPKQKH